MILRPSVSAVVLVLETHNILSDDFHIWGRAEVRDGIYNLDDLCMTEARTDD